jgi:hypothetical protein
VRRIDARQAVDPTAVTKNVTNNGAGPLVMNTGVLIGDRKVTIEPGETKSVRMSQLTLDALSGLSTVKIT